MGPGLTEALIRYSINNEDAGFLDFIRNSKSNGRWLVSSDFCLNDKTYLTRSCAVSLIPLDEHPQDISDRIKLAIPKDLKKTKNVEPRTIETFKDPRMFHFVFILDGHRNIISTGDESAKLEAARNYVTDMVGSLKRMNCPPAILKPFKKLLQESKAKGFNYSLLSDIVAVSAILSFISAALVRQGAELIGLFPDRDRITEWCDAIYSDLVQLYVGGVLELVDSKKYAYEIKRATTNKQGGEAWFDSLVRLPDYLAGVVAGWDVDRNSINGDKRAEVFMENIVDAKNIIVLRLVYDGKLHVERIVANRR